MSIFRGTSPMPARISLLLAGLLPGLTSSLLLAGLLPGLTLLLVAAQARADALVVTQAMLATTIAEFTIEEDRVEVDLEIGQGDFEAFRNLLPDDLYAELGHPPAPWPERIGQFFERDFGVAAGDGPRLTGRLLLIEPRLRVRRDVVSGEPLPAPEGEDEETILFVRLEFPLPVRPDSLTLFGTRGSQAASVGFVAYHGGIAVNDFRYLGPSQTLDLDWDDPWYTRFRARALVRRYFAPMSGFIYVEPYEVRKEIIARPLDLQHWIDLGLEGREVIPAQMQPELQRRVAEFLRGHQKVIID